ncbi:MAG: MFS transporter [Gemmataceae bacterium]
MDEKDHGIKAVPGATAQPSNAMWLLWAGFMAILAAGVGFAIRGGILRHWGKDFDFSAEELGRITGGGFTGFCFGIIIGGVIADKVGYGKLVISAFLLHVVSALVTFVPAYVTPLPKDSVYLYLFWGSFLFAVANGNLEAVANPLVATLFPHNRTHYLNILHASWPAGLVLGGAAGWILDDKFHWPWHYQLALYMVPVLLYGLMFLGQPMPKSEASKRGLSLGQMFKDVGLLGGLVVCFLLAMFFSGVVTPLVTPADPSDPVKLGAVQKKLELAREALAAAGNADPEAAALATLTAADKEIHDENVAYLAKVESTERIVSYVGYGFGFALLVLVGVITNFSLGAILLFVLFIAHALVGAVELGTDGWIQNITGNLLTSEQGKILFVFTSAVMFSLRFCADFIEKKLGLSPVGILLVCAVLACGGLLLTSRVDSFLFALVALGVYAVGKTFFWPTMLAVASDRFPRTGAVAISIMGGIGMMSAGLIGAPGLGYAKDRFSGEALKEKKPALYEEYKADNPKPFLVFKPAAGLAGKKYGAIQDKLARSREELKEVGITDPQAALRTLTPEEKAAIAKEHGPDKLKAVEEKMLTEDEREVFKASIEGDRRTLVADAAIPATMAVIYLLLLLYFKTIGGYKAIHIAGEDAAALDAARAEGEG